MRVTIKDVSQAAGVSVATVSNVLNSPDVVAPSTRDRVLAVVAELGYRPSRAAQALQQQRTYSIGYRMPSSTDEFALDVFLHRMAARAGDAGLDIVLFTPRTGQTEIEAYTEMIRRGAVDGFVLSGTEHGDERVDYLLGLTVPFVTFGRTHVLDQHPWVDVDGERGVHDAVEHLIEVGHRDIALLAWPEGSLVGDERASGYAQAVAEAGLEPSPDLVVRTPNDVEEARRATAELLDRPSPPTAIMAIQDLLALGAMVAVRDAGLRVGHDIAIVGFDDIPRASAADPPLSTVRQPMDAVGEIVIELLLERLDEQSTVRSELVSPELVVRASSTP